MIGQRLYRLFAVAIALVLVYLGIGLAEEGAWRLYLGACGVACLLAFWPGRRTLWQMALGIALLGLFLIALFPWAVGEGLRALLGSAVPATGAVALLALFALLWPGPPEAQEPSLGTNVRRLGALLLTAFVLLSAQLLRLQVVAAEAVRTRVAYLPSGEVIADPRPVLEERRIQRGRIFDRNGVLLAATEVTSNGWARRRYLRTDLGHIVGFYNPLYGSAGLEATYDDALAGRTAGDPWEALLEGLLHRPHRGNDLHLTLDVALQQTAEDALGRRAGAVVLLDVRSGAILAMASYPRFDPQPLLFDPEADDWAREQRRVAAYWQQLSISTTAPLLNRATQGLYPPGSTFKTLTAAAALEYGLVTPETVVPCPDEFVVTGHRIVNFMDGLGALMVRQDLVEDYVYSCNTAYAQVGLLVGAERYSEMALRFGLSFADAPPPEPFLQELPSAPSTIAHTRSFLDRETALADTAYGQGELQVTPLQAALLVATVANDGLMMRPYLVERVEDPAGRVLYQARPTPLAVPIGVRTARMLQRMMVAVVDHGTGRWWKPIEGVRVGGKTGSAEAGTGATHAWFLAFAPADGPRYAVTVVVEHGGAGSEAAAPIAREVLNAALQR
jgi:peptidoglycan glycosyltransferase